MGLADGCKLLKNIPKMHEMTAEIVKQVDLPVTVKTRLGWDDSTIQIIEVAKRMLSTALAPSSLASSTMRSRACSLDSAIIFV